MKIKTLIIRFTLGLPLFFFVNLSHASNKYTSCNTTQIEQLKSLIPITTDEFSDDKNYQSCLLIDPTKQTFLVAKSNQISVNKNEKGEEESSTYDLTAYLVDGKQQKLLSKKLLSSEIGSDALHFDGIELDTTPFSTLPNKTVVGILQKSSHSGGISYHYDDLQLLKIDDKSLTPIGTITTDSSNGMAWDNACRDKGSHWSSVKRTLILSDQVTNGLQDIVVKTTKTNEQTTGKDCKETKNVWKKQQINKFNGKNYPFKLDGFTPDPM